MTATRQQLEQIARALRFRTVRTSHLSGTPHLGSCLSCVDLLVYLYWRVLRIDTRKWIAAKLRPGRWGEVQAPKAQTAVTFKIGLPLMDRGGGGITIDATPVAEALPDGAEAA